MLMLNEFSSTTLPIQSTFMKTLNGTNYKEWGETLKLYLVIINIDLALREDKPVMDANFNAKPRANHETRVHSNLICFMVLKYTMDKTIQQSIPKSQNAKEIFNLVIEIFIKFDKAKKKGYYKLKSMNVKITTYNGANGVQGHILKLVHYYYKLKSMNVGLGDNL